jgi:hypothetical protein
MWQELLRKAMAGKGLFASDDDDEDDEDDKFSLCVLHISPNVFIDLSL